MKNKTLIIAFIAIISFAMAGCPTPTPQSLIEMVSVPGGSFQMGKELGTAGSGDVSTVHTVKLTGFKMSKYEVTQKQYEAVVGSNPSGFQGASYLPASGEKQENRPVETVSWYDAVEFCNKLSELEKLEKVYTISGRSPASGYPITSATVAIDWTKNGYRLPTEAEWEYAAKGGNTPDNTTYSGSDNISDVAWYDVNSGNRTHEVGKKDPNGLGLHDMSGNVWELCWDWYDYSYDSAGNGDNPKGPASGTDRVVRGGGWNYSATGVRSAYRYYSSPTARYNTLGFRLVRP